tara:strand:- start:1547 stop:2041 length:495 start_codon:yes stop_codon:yes gene_type:complete
MNDRLFVGVLGNRDSGKSTTWNTLFSSTVRTGKYPRQLILSNGKCVEVFLVSGSPEERGEYAGDILSNQTCRIVLCSIQYTETVRQTLDFVAQNGFDLFVQWLNPGYKDTGEGYDRLGLIPWLLGQDATLAMRNAQVNPISRTEEIRQFVHGWAEAQKLTFNCS